MDHWSGTGNQGFGFWYVVALRQVKPGFFSFFSFWHIQWFFFKVEHAEGACETLKICQTFGKKWRKPLFNPFFSWFQVPNNPISGSQCVTNSTSSSVSMDSQIVYYQLPDTVKIYPQFQLLFLRDALEPWDVLFLFTNIFGLFFHKTWFL